MISFTLSLGAEPRLIDFGWYTVPTYTNYSSTELLAPGKGEIGFGTSNFFMWCPNAGGYDVRTFDLLFRIGVLPHMELGIKYSSPHAMVLDACGGFEAGRVELTGSLGFGYLHYTKPLPPDSSLTCFYILDGYPTLALGYKIAPWLRAVVSCKGIISYYIRQIQWEGAQEMQFLNLYGGLGLTLDVGAGDWRIRPEIIPYKAASYSNLYSEPTRFHTTTLGVSVVYRPKG
ncbi:hypothetical protein CEE36_02545 [candidate division TA06 bacterium B3_TA06]|uniref:Uncharacterized protein n=1 Tax=candidate division TA06 bacterium B3_TA06 TaxID=2012487 RepID=A0A532VAL9_UNCT6|nr:MAG: hypothetical protein CEE36_02545 [candidate division TA06 bacterium B3_TA06]